MAPLYPEEVDVFTVPHSRMKELVNVYSQQILSGDFDFSNCHAVQSLLHTLHATFNEFISHEKIENEFIMHKLKNKLKAMSIQNSAVCNCHSDNMLSDMLKLVELGYACTSKPAVELINYGRKLQIALRDFTDTFLPHMQEEEEVFQPLLMKYFEYEELKRLKRRVIFQHEKLKSELEPPQGSYENEIPETAESEKLHQDSLESEESTDDEDEALLIPEIQSDEEGCISRREEDTHDPFSLLPTEVCLLILQNLTIRDLISCSAVSRRWNNVSMDPALWREIYPAQWAAGIWTKVEPPGINNWDFHTVNKMATNSRRVHDADADIDESEYESRRAESSLVDENVIVINGIINNLLPRVGRGVTTLGLAGCASITSKQIGSILKLCANLESIDLSYTAVKDCAFAGLGEGSLQKLRYLDLSGCVDVTDDGLKALAFALLPPNDVRLMENKDLRDKCCGGNVFCDYPYCACENLECPCNIEESNSGFKNLKRKSGLCFFSISGCCEVTEDGLLFLSELNLLRGLRGLDVSGCWKISGEGLRECVEGCSELLPQNLYYCDNIVNGPYPTTANGCQNLFCQSRACCRADM